MGQVRVRFGYVAMAIDIADSSPSKTVTATNLSKIVDEEGRIIKLRKIAKGNLINTLRILKYNEAHHIKVYRFTSKLVPLATHPIAEGWDYIADLKEEFRDVGDYVKENKMRVSSHPDHFTLLNSPREDVLKASLKDLEYHVKVYEAMGLGKESKIVLHIGGVYGNKDKSIERFIENFQVLPEAIKGRIILENDDKIYTAEDVLNICKAVDIPMVLDIHHHRCNNSSAPIEKYLESIFSTWDHAEFPPKIHLSSPRPGKDMRYHADFVEIEDFLQFLYKAKELDRDFDVMIEAKQKNLALHKLMEDLKEVKNVQVVKGAEIIF